MALWIRGGTVVNADRSFRADVLCDQGRIVAADQAQAVTILVTPRPSAGALSDAASKPPFIAGPHAWREYARKLGIDHALFVDATGKVSVTRALSQRLQFAEGVVPAEVVE